jgi:hypothetical protein
MDANTRNEKFKMIIEQLTETNKSLLLWVLDLISNFARYESESKMGINNLAIVFAPNLYSRKVENPMLLVILANKMAEMLANMVEVYRSEFENVTKVEQVEPEEEPQASQEEWDEYYRKLKEWEDSQAQEQEQQQDQ